MEDSDSEEDYGYIRPTLNRMLRSILDQYPDDGQILKELIQNAEDAGAKVVKFVYDDSEYPTNYLHHPDMAQFQGPALFAYNDAAFEEKDWKGIRMLQESIKEKDPMKVGRFGLGFKSVLHMTDLPSVLSKDRLYMIDPHEKYFHYKGQCTSGYTWHLQRKKEAMKQIPDQFLPFQQILDCSENTFQQSYYDGTLFRFPLRLKESELSDTLYDNQKMLHLLEAFQKDAHLMLLFLKNIEVIEIYHRKQGTMEKVFSVTLECADIVRRQRQDFKQQCMDPVSANPDGIDISYQINIKTITYRNSRSHTTTWMVSEYKAGTKTSQALQILSKDQSLSLVPLVGVALETNHNPDQQDKNPNGQVFCSLPLPIEQKSPTGLPVHVNGYFAISQNRQHLKWSTTGMSQSDKSVQWNLCLLQELLPVAYCNLLKKAVDSRFSPNVIYKNIPDEGIVDHKWKIMLPQLYKMLLELPIIHTPNRGGQWLKAGEVIFEDEKQPLSEILREVFLQCDINLAYVPQHISKELEKRLGRQALQMMSPHVAREKLRKNKPSYCRRSIEEKLEILHYILMDGYHNQLHGLELLPCADGKMIEFKQKTYSTQPIWIPTEKAPRDLFPGLESLLLADNLPEDLLHLLSLVADQGIYQLCSIKRDTVHSLIRMILPKEWFSQNIVTVDPACHVTSEWLSKLWAYLCQEFPDDLQQFEGLHIMSVDNSKGFILDFLRKPPLNLLPLKVNCHVLRQSKGVGLNKDIESILQLFRINVLQSVPSYILKHPMILGHYISPPYDREIIELLYASYLRYGQSISEVGQKATESARTALVSLVTRLDNLESVKKVFLQKLPIFPSTRMINGQIQYVSVESSPEGTDLSGLPCKVSKIFIDTSSSTVCNAAKKLNVTILSSKDVLHKYVLVEMKKGTFDVDEIQSIMDVIFHDVQKYGDWDILKDVSFVKCNKDLNAGLKTPSKLYDPCDNLLQDMFEGEVDKFPVGKYAEPQRLLHLRQMGLRSANDVLPIDIWECVNRVKQQPRNEKIKKSRAVLSLLSKKPHLLQKYVTIGGKKQKLIDHVRKLSWVPLMNKPPEKYPSSLAWCSSSKITGKPSEVKAASCSQLVGSVCEIIENDVSLELMELFGWNHVTDLDLVLEHMEQIIESYQPNQKAYYLDLVGNVYDFMCRAAEDEGTGFVKNAIKRKLSDWVWHGDGFTSVDCIFKEKQDIDMRPHVYSIPSEMACRAEFFCDLGMENSCDVKRTINVLHQIAYQLKTDRKREKQNLQLAVDILNMLKDNITCLPIQERSQIWVPVEPTHESSGIEMLPIEECAYCDEEWFKQETKSFTDQSIRLLHPNVPMSTAEMLGVPTLISKILPATDLPITEFGQGQPLTARLKSLLENYEDGLAIFKEMIQNADDAGATEVKFMLDERSNKEYRSKLIDKGMRECQGPALWVYNNAEFTDQDFSNIIKLEGGTKAEEPTKIGKFGLGFNVVYNITDVPSFISKNTMVIFDPHIKYLGKLVKHNAQPGIKLELKNRKDIIETIADQFQPYSDIFACKLAEQDAGFDGTLFRLPLRTRDQAKCSDICNVEYDKARMIKLFQMMVDNSHNMLIFTQHVNKLSLHYLAEGTAPKDSLEVFCLEKKEELLSQKGLPEQLTTFLEVAADHIYHGSMDTLEQTMLITTQCTCHPDNQLGLVCKQPEKHWLLTECLGSGESMRMAKEIGGGFVPIGGVATFLEKRDDGMIPRKMDKALAYSFLPLPIETKMTVHINGKFAIESNRKHICEKNPDKIGLEDSKAKWNEALLTDAVVMAYFRNLEAISDVLPPYTEFDCHELWPSFDTIQVCKPLSTGFYQDLSKLMYIPFTSDSGSLIPLERVLFLDVPEVLTDQATEVMNVVRSGYHVIKPPRDVLECLTNAGHSEFVQERLFDLQRFYEEIFFVNIQVLDKSVRDPLVVYALEAKQQQLDNLLKRYDCIPASPKGTVLKKICDLIHPRREAGKLYVPEDARFPHGKPFNEPEILKRLVELGIGTDDITWDELAERAKSVEDVMKTGEKKGNTRLEFVLEYLDRKLNKSPSNKSQCPDITKKRLQQTAFLQVMPKPSYWPIEWAAETTNRKQLFCPKDIYSLRMKDLVSSTDMIVRDHKITDRIEIFLGIDEKSASVEQVAKQMEQVINLNLTTLRNSVFMTIQGIITQLYVWLQEHMRNQDQVPSQIKDVLEHNPCILVGRLKQFFRPDQLAINHTEDCLPILGVLPSNLHIKFRNLMMKLGVKDHFEIEDYIKALQEAKTNSGDEPITANHLRAVINLLTLLNHAMEKEKLDFDTVQKNNGDIFIPNTQGVLQISTSLCYDDCQLVTSKGMDFVHKDLTYDTSDRLGVKTKKRKILAKYGKSFSFGQKESLTNSLCRILANYPCDQEILKELIQNADDAGATIAHFVLDTRKHPSDRIFDDSWKPIQGPSLLVYNNKPFTAKDLEGIQRLGEGSKQQDPCQTGQYGIGFSSVYHLTDVPSIMTHTAETGRTLCVFDPQCKYVPDATPAEPGIRYEQVCELEENFPDVFGCYLQDQFDMESGTMFRFPFRTSAFSESELGGPITIETIQAILDELKKELHDLLLFTNNLRKISISEINPKTGQLTKTYHVELDYNSDAEECRSQIAEEVKNYSSIMKKHITKRELEDVSIDDISLMSVPHREFIYQLHIKDNEGYSALWCVCQSTGLIDGTQIPESVTDISQKGKLALMPRGGAAWHLQITEGSPKPRAFCSLPLKGKTGLPVHINGHFALGHENRGNIWNKNEPHLYKKEWNDLLCETVIAESYVNLLSQLKNSHCEQTETIGTELIDRFLRLLPTLDTDEDWHILVTNVYQTLAMRNARIFPVMQAVETRNGRNTEHASGTSWYPAAGVGSQKVYFSCITEKGTEKMSKPYRSSAFTSSSPGVCTDLTKKTLEDILLDCGLRVVQVKLPIYNTLQHLLKKGKSDQDNSRNDMHQRSTIEYKSGSDATADSPIPVTMETAGTDANESGSDSEGDILLQNDFEISFVTPDTVVDFFKSFCSENTPCLHDLSKLINETLLVDQNLMTVFEYCLQQDKIIHQLDGLPLLMTKDLKLRVFKKSDPVFTPQHSHLIPKRKDRFIIDRQWEAIMRKIRAGKYILRSEGEATIIERSCVFKKLTVTDLGELLKDELHEELWSKQIIPWNLQHPSSDWLHFLWDFLTNQIMCEENDKGDRVLKKQDINDITRLLQPTENVSLITAVVKQSSVVDDSKKVSNKYVLVPIADAQHVISSQQEDDEEQRDLQKVLVNIGIPHLYVNPFFPKYRMDNWDYAILAKELVTTLKNPTSILEILHKHCTEFTPNLLPTDSSMIMKYFSSNLAEIENRLGLLRELPIYITSSGSVISLANRQAFVIPREMPEAGMDLFDKDLSDASDVVFLQDISEYTDVYEKLACDSKNIADLYCDFIFLHFEYLDEHGQDNQIIHLHYLFKKLQKVGNEGELTKQEEGQLLSNLRKLPFLKDHKGTLQPASEFYDEEVEAFKVIIPADKLTPSAPNGFRTDEWKAFLSMAGMVTKVNRVLFLEVAREILCCTESAPTLSQYDASIIMKYFSTNLAEIEAENKLGMLRELPIYITSSGSVISLANRQAFVIPREIPKAGMDLWNKDPSDASRVVFLQDRPEYIEVCKRLKCTSASKSIADLYCEYIFLHFEYLDEHGQDNQIIHLHYLFKKLQKVGNEGELTNQEEGRLLSNLRKLPFLKDHKGTLQPASEFYDEEVEVFKAMIPVDKLTPSVPEQFSKDEWRAFLSMAGMVTEVNRELFLKFAKEIEGAGPNMEPGLALDKSKKLTQHLFRMKSRFGKLGELSNIKYIVAEPVSQHLGTIHPQFNSCGGKFLAFRGSASHDNEPLVWTQTPVLPEWADPMKQKFVNMRNIDEICIADQLGVHSEVPNDMVAGNLIAVCRNIIEENMLLNNTHRRMNIRVILKMMYKHLNTNNAWQVRNILGDERFILAREDTVLVKAQQTVVNLSNEDEIRPYLYRIPNHLGEYVPFFQQMGTTDKPAVHQYSQVLGDIKAEVGESCPNPNKLVAVSRAIRGLFQVMGEFERSIDNIANLFLLDENKCLEKASCLIYNDAPAYYNRIQGRELPFVMDLRHFGLNSSLCVKLLEKLPKAAQPKLLSRLIKEQLLPGCELDRGDPDTENALEQRLRSEAFMAACQRLICHEAHAVGEQICEKKVTEAIQCLSVIKITNLSQLKTHLFIKDKIIHGSGLDKVCFKKKSKNPHGISQWQLYIRCEGTRDTLSPDLLIPLSETINEILDHRLQNSVIYLPLLLTCAESEMQRKLDQQNITIGGVQSSSSISFLPNPGDLLEDHNQLQMNDGQTNFDIGEYVGVEIKGRKEMIYGLIKKEVSVAGDKKVYEIGIGKGLVCQFSANKIFKFI